jgi:hypothetical protein
VRGNPNSDARRQPRRRGALAFVYALRVAAKPVPYMAEPPGIEVPADLDPKAGP